MYSIRFKALALTLIAGFLAPTLRAEEPKKPWSDSAEVSVVSANGNTKSTTSSGKNTFLYNWAKTALEVVFGGMGASSDGHTTAERYFAHEKVSQKISDRNYVFEKAAWDKDRFAGISDRYDLSVGLGRELIRSDLNLLIGEVGGGYISEERTVGPRNDFTSGRAYAKYTRTLSPTSNASQDIEYLANFEDSDDFRVNTESALTAAINAHFSMKLSYVWKHVGSPPPGFHRNDTITTVSIIANY